MTIARLPKPSIGITKDIGVKWEVATITPSAAAAMLEKNTINRPLRSRTIVQKYASDMKRGAWKMTFDAIRFDEHGNLLDGQHRLSACVQAEVPFTSLVIYDMPEDIRPLIDSGASRTTGDVLQMRGFHSARNLAASVRWLIAIKSGVDNPRITDVRASNSDVLDMLAKHPALPASVLVTSRLARFAPSPSLVATLHYIGSQILDKAERADAFVNVFVSGVPDYDDCPAHHLREFVLKMRGTRSGLMPAEYWRSTVHVWNVFAERRGMKRLQWPKLVAIDGLDVETML